MVRLIETWGLPQRDFPRIVRIRKDTLTLTPTLTPTLTLTPDALKDSFLFGALISATDPVATLSIMGADHMPTRTLTRTRTLALALAALTPSP